VSASGEKRGSCEDARTSVLTLVTNGSHRKVLSRKTELTVSSQLKGGEGIHVYLVFLIAPQNNSISILKRTD
jgi:hypothetical protein